MMVGVAILAIFSRFVIGLGQHGRRFFGVPPLYLVVTFPFLLTIATTFVVTLVPVGAVERARRNKADRSSRVNQTGGGPPGHDTPARKSKLQISVPAIAGSFGLLSVSTGRRWGSFCRL